MFHELPPTDSFFSLFILPHDEQGFKGVARRTVQVAVFLSPLPEKIMNLRRDPFSGTKHRDAGRIRHDQLPADAPL
jgi:hypothetical protein